MRYFLCVAYVLPLCILGCSDSGRPTQLRPGTTFEVYTVAAQPGSNTRALLDPDTGTSLNLVGPPAITAAHVRAATVAIDENGVAMLQVTVDNPGAAKLRAATAVLGKQLAIVVNGKIAATPIVRAPISNAFTISGTHSRSDWEEILE